MTRPPLPTLGYMIRDGGEIAVHCLDCYHFSVAKPAALAARVGEDLPVIDLYRLRLLKCSACGSRNATVRHSNPHAPFSPGWHTRPQP